MNETERIGVSRVQLIVYERLHWIFREQPIDDCGIDAHIELKNDIYAEGRLIAVQIKSGESYFRRQKNNKIAYRVDEKHIKYWASCILPVIIVLYNPRTEECIWEYTGKVNNMQIYIDSCHIFNESAKDELIRIANIEPYEIARNNRKKFIESHQTWFFKKDFENETIKYGHETQVAIDFGTTKTMLGFTGGGRQITIVKTDEEKNYFDTAVGFDENYQYYIGVEALRRRGDPNFIVVRNFKRKLGMGKKYLVHGLSFSAEDITTLFLETILSYTESKYKIDIKKCWISQPVDFLYSQVKSYEQCIKNCNLTVGRTLMEPCCVSINKTVTERGEIEIIFDMGGGTFDAVLCSNMSGLVEILDSAGDRTIGGIDYDDTLEEIIKEKLKKMYPDILLNYKLKNQICDKAEEIKIILSKKEKAIVTFAECYLTKRCETVSCCLEINRKEFRKVTTLLNFKAEHVIKEIASKYWSLSGWDYIDAANSVILIGGQGAKIFTIQEIIKKWFPKIPIVDSYSDKAVVEGLTKYMTNLLSSPCLKDMVLLDIVYFDLLLTGKKLYIENEEKQEKEETEVVVLSKDDYLCTKHTIQFKIDCDQEISVIVERGNQRDMLRKYYLHGSNDKTIYNITINTSADRKIIGYITGNDENIKIYQFEI